MFIQTVEYLKLHLCLDTCQNLLVQVVPGLGGVLGEDTDSENSEPWDSVSLGGLNLTANPAEDSLIHDAIPYLPMSLALFCMLMNVIGCGTGWLNR